MPFTAFQNHDRECLPSSVKSWPLPNDSIKWMLRVAPRTTSSSVRTQRDGDSHMTRMVEAAMHRPDIDALDLNGRYLSTGGVSLTHLGDLLKQDRQWKVRLTLAGEVHAESDSVVEILNLFQKVPFLEILIRGPGTQLQEFPKKLEKALETLATTGSLRELNLDSVDLSPSIFASYYANEALAKVTPHVSLVSPPGDGLPPILHFPSTASDHLKSLKLQLYDEDSALFGAHLMQLASESQNLRAFTVTFALFDDSHYRLPMECLAAWIASPSCQLTQLSLHLAYVLTENEGESVPSCFSKIFLPALAQNSSIQELELLGVADHDAISALCTTISSENSSLQHLVLARTFFIEPETVELLLQCQLQLRSRRRFLSVLLLDEELSEDPAAAKVHCVSRMHAYWKSQWQYSTDRSRNQHQRQGDISASMMMRPRSLWASTLEQLDETTQPDGRRILSLDFMYYVMKIWVTDTSVVPKQCMTPPCEEPRIIQRVMDDDIEKEEDGSPTKRQRLLVSP